MSETRKPFAVSGPWSPAMAAAIDHDFDVIFARVAQEAKTGFLAVNGTANGMFPGQAVYVSGSDRGVPVLQLAKADAAATMPAEGLVAESIAPSATGQVLTAGVLKGYDTRAWAFGNALYVSAATAGDLTNTAPGSTNLDQVVAKVLDVGEAGSLLITVQSESKRHALLSGTHTDTTAATVVRGDVVVGQSATPTWQRLALGAAGTLTRSDGTDLKYSTFTIPATFAQGDVVYASAANVLAALAKDATATRYVSNTGASNAPAWAQVNLANGITGTLPIANGGSNNTTFTAGSVLFFDGTKIDEDNAGFVWDDAGKRLFVGSGTSFWGDTLEVRKAGYTSIDAISTLNNSTARLVAAGTSDPLTNNKLIAFFTARILTAAKIIVGELLWGTHVRGGIVEAILLTKQSGQVVVTSDAKMVINDTGVAVGLINNAQGATLTFPAAPVHCLTEGPTGVTPSTPIDVLYIETGAVQGPGVGFGPRLQFLGRTATVFSRAYAAIDAVITDTTDATRTARLDFSTVVSASQAVRFSLVGTGVSGTPLSVANGGTGVTVAAICDGRLTLTSGTPVTTADVTAATTIYFAPYAGNRLALYDGTSVWTVYAFAEVSLALGTLTAALPYDVFVYNSAGTPTLEALAWTNATTRATALTTQNGVLVKSGATTRRYLGTFYTTSTTTTEDSARRRLLYNYYNRVPKDLRRVETTATWTYTVNTLRQANNSGTNQVEVVNGRSESSLWLTVSAVANNASQVNITATIGEDSTTAKAGESIGGWTALGVANISQLVEADLSKIPAEGFHFYAWLEASNAAGVTTWYGPATISSGTGASESGLAGRWEC